MTLTPLLLATYRPRCSPLSPAHRQVTAKGCGRRYYQLLEENQRIKSGRANYDGLSAGPVAEDNLFYWNASIFGPEGMCG